MSKHTPGPWFSDEEGIVRTTLPFPHYPKYFKPVPVASAWREGAWVGEDGTDESRANGQLMAAAPELLEVLRGVLKIDRGTSGRIIIEGWQEEVIRAAIAKATGETNEQ